MALFGPVGALMLAALTASVADLAGNSSTRGFTRGAFGVVALRAMGVTVSGVVSTAYDVAGAIPI